MRRKIYVDASDMLRLREQGMSNHDIAKSLDVSIQTVRRYIGKQNGHMEGLAAFKDDKPIEKKETELVLPRYDPKPFREWYDNGDFNFEVNHNAHKIVIELDNKHVCIPFDKVPDLVQFLAWAMRVRIDVTKGEVNVNDTKADEVWESEDDTEWY